jgi:hypothetical protein
MNDSPSNPAPSAPSPADAAATPAEQASGKARPSALSPEQLATILGRISREHITAEMIALDIDAGAPTNPDGSLNVIHYTAWLVREMAEPGGASAD